MRQREKSFGSIGRVFYKLIHLYATHMVQGRANLTCLSLVLVFEKINVYACSIKVSDDEADSSEFRFT